MKRYEIIIKPEDKIYCGNCTYKELGQFRDLISRCVFEEWYCGLFDESLSRWIANIEPPIKPGRCWECKKLTDNFEKMPEDDHGNS